jgi:hypothetical protein
MTMPPGVKWMRNPDATTASENKSTLPDLTLLTCKKPLHASLEGPHGLGGTLRGFRWILIIWCDVTYMYYHEDKYTLKYGTVLEGFFR